MSPDEETNGKPVYVDSLGALGALVQDRTDERPPRLNPAFFERIAN